MSTAPANPNLNTKDALPLPRDTAYTQRLDEVNQMDMIDLAIKAKRLAASPHGTWIAPTGFMFLGAGIGAVIAGADFESGGVLGTLGIGLAFLLGAYMVRTQRTETAGYFCADFMRYIDQWPPVRGNEKNSAYVAREALLTEPPWLIVRYRRLKWWLRELRKPQEEPAAGDPPPAIRRRSS
jgi:hypothetical protein